MLHRRVRVRRRSAGVHITRRRRFTLVAAILGSSVAAIDGTIVNVALPAIQADSAAELQAQRGLERILLTLGSLILIGGSPGDICGDGASSRQVSAFGVLSPPVRWRSGRDADRGTSPARRCGCAADAELAGDRAAALERARRGDRLMDRLRADRRRRRPASRRPHVDQTSWRWIFAINVRSCWSPWCSCGLPFRTHQRSGRHV